MSHVHVSMQSSNSAEHAARPLTRARPIRRSPDRRPKPASNFLRVLAPLLLALLLIAPAAAQDATPEATPAAVTAVDPLSGAVAWLLAQQAEDGGFVGFSGASEAGITADAVLALAAYNATCVAPCEPVDLSSARAFLEAGALVTAQTGAGQAAKLVLAIAALGGDPADIGGVNALILTTAGADLAAGTYGSGVFDHALVILALAAAGEPVPQEAIDRLLALQISDGSWAYDASTEPGLGDTNTTALVIQSLVASGIDSGDAVARALDYLRSTQLEDGGFTYQPGPEAAADANSTGIVIQAIVAAGQDPAAPQWNGVLARLLAFQNESGAFRYQDAAPDDNLFATVQALPALALQPFPIPAQPAGPATPTT